MDDAITQKQPPMAKKKEFKPGENMPASLIGTAGVEDLKTSKKNVAGTIKRAVIARRRDKKNVK